MAVYGVQFKIDGNNLGDEDTVPPYELVWNSTTVLDGPHTISAVARDAAGSTATTAVNVTVTNTPAVTLPDLVVTNLSYNNGIFTSIVKNQGSKATPAGVTVGVGYFIDGRGRTWGSIPGPLAAGASATINMTGPTYVIPSGNHSIMAYGDDVNRFAESSEDNNKLTQSIVVP